MNIIYHMKTDEIGLIDIHKKFSIKTCQRLSGIWSIPANLLAFGSPIEIKEALRERFSAL